MTKLSIDQIQSLAFSKLTSPVNSGLVVNQAGTVAELKLYSPIGSMFERGIDGARVAEEIDWLSSIADTIVIRVNTYGGSVADGMSIMAAMQRSKAKIICIIDGIAASIGSVIAICANETYIVDYGLVMIHTTNYSSGEGDSSVLEKFDESLSLVYQKRLNKSPKEVAEFFVKGKDTWMNAEEAKAAGIVNDVLPTVARDLVNTAKQIISQAKPSAIQIAEVANMFQNHFSQTKTKQMNVEVLNALGLESTSTGDAVVNAIGSLKSSLTAKEVANEALRADVANKVTEIESLNAKVAAFEAAENVRKDAEVKEVIDGAVKARKIANNAESIERWTKLAKADITSVKEALNSLQASAKLSDLIKGDDKDKEVEFKPLTVSAILENIATKTKKY